MHRVQASPSLEPSPIAIDKAHSLQPTVLADLPLSAKVIECLTLLEPLHDCALVLDDARIPYHGVHLHVKLAEVSTVLRRVT